MFAPTLVQVESVGEHVALSIGNWRKELHYEVAVLLAAWMQECARDAKRWLGITREGLRGVGTLHDASNANWLAVGQPADPRHTRRVSRDTLRREQIAVRQNGADVDVNFGSALATIPHKAARSIAQMIRMKAKESKMRAGDNARHWNAITAEHVARRGPGVTRG